MLNPSTSSPDATSPDAIVAALDPDQREVAQALTGPVVVLAGAGTGKTRAITHRIAYGVRTGVYTPQSMLAVTFTARAAGEMRSRLSQLGVSGVQARTFHAAALRQLSFFWPTVIGGAPHRILEHKAPVIAEAARSMGVDVDRLMVRDLAGEVEWMKVSLVAPDNYPQVARAQERELPAGLDFHTVARLATVYEEMKNQRAVMDFEDVITILSGILTERSDIADKVRAQYRHFVVDEYQDVSPLQQFLLDLWLGGRKELCVVGDPSQTIYSFAGASPHYLLNFTQRYPDAVQVRLERDYRSTPQVVHVANEVLRRGKVAGALELRAQRPSGPQVRYVEYSDDEAEAAGVAARAKALMAQGVAASQIAVLMRTNAQSEAFEQALSDAGVGYQVHGGQRFFQRKDVRDAIALLRGSALGAPVEGPMPDQVRDVLSEVGWAPQAPAARGAVRERWDVMQALVALADSMAAQDAGTGSGSGPVTMAMLVEELAHRAASQHTPTVEGVTLASLHAAKGLEWDAVFLVGMSEGLMPISLAQGPQAEAEERRLLYVGVTRARIHLDVSYAKARNPGGRASRRRTRFLDGIWPQANLATGNRSRLGGAGSGSGLGRVKPRDTLTTDSDRQLFDALKAWRQETAKQAGAPAYTVLADAVLAAIAETRPHHVPALVAICGIGPAKVDKYGDAVLQIVSQHAATTPQKA